MSRLKKINLGSPQWHKLQEELSRGSAVGLDIQKRNLFYEKTLPQCKGALYVHPGVYICYPENVYLGYNVFINRGAYFTAPEKIVIGDNALIGPYTIFNSGEHIYSDPNKLIRDQGHKLAPIQIEDDVWIGAHSIILPGVTIGKGAVVGANSIVRQNVDPYSVVAGSPARFIRIRKNA